MLRSGSAGAGPCVNGSNINVTNRHGRATGAKCALIAARRGIDKIARAMADKPNEHRPT